MKKMPVKTGIDDLTRLALVNNLKQKIRMLKQQVEDQKKIIEGYKRSTKTTLINEQQVQIQKLNDENKRLLLIIQDLKSQNQTQQPLKNLKRKHEPRPSLTQAPKKKQSSQQQHTGQQAQQDKPPKKQKQKQPKKTDFQSKYYQILLQNDKIRKQLLVLRANEHVIKNKKPLNQRSSILMQNNINQFDKIRQKNYELEAELASCEGKNGELKERIAELEELLERALQINKSMKII